jgi:membrane protein YdbS with pleckstrin-like domain
MNDIKQLMRTHKILGIVLSLLIILNVGTWIWEGQTTPIMIIALVVAVSALVWGLFVRRGVKQ